MLHPEALGGSVAEFDAAVEGRTCPFLNEMGEVALGEMRSVYEQVNAGNYEAMGELAERLAAAAEQKGVANPAIDEVKTVAATEAEDSKRVVIKEPLTLFDESTRIVPDKGITQHTKVESQQTINPAEAAAQHTAESIMHQTQLEVAQQTALKDVEAESSTKPQIVAQNRMEHGTKIITKDREIAAQLGLTDSLVRQEPHKTTIATPVEQERPSITDDIDIDESQLEITFKEPTTETHTSADISVPSIEPFTAENDYINEDYEAKELSVVLNIPEFDGATETVPILNETEVYTDEQLEDMFDPETIETYKELVVLIAANELEPFALEGREEGLNVILLEPMETDSDKPIVKDFETFIAEQPPVEELITLELIQRQANDQPLEQTFIQLTELLANIAEGESTKPKQFKLSEILQEIESTLHACYINRETEESKLQITPEMTEKLLVLLCSLGYEHPREVLVEFVRQYSLAFLLQALQHMCQLNSKENRYEFLVAASTPPINDNTRAHISLGRLLVDLVISKPLAAKV